jgi:hypothetical protein
MPALGLEVGTLDCGLTLGFGFALVTAAPAFLTGFVTGEVGYCR